MATSIVLGAGMVGVSTALALQERGDDVVLLDRKGIGRETSYGNAGAIQTEAVEPTAFPRDLSFLLKAAFKQENAINWHLSGLAEQYQPVYEFWKNSAPKPHAAISEWYSRFTAHAEDFHQPLIEAAGAQDLIRRIGYFAAFRSPQSFEANAKKAQHLKNHWQVPLDILDGESLGKLEPTMKRAVAGAVHYTNVWSCQSPGALTAAYGELFIKRGGTFAYGDALSLEPQGNGQGGYRVQTEHGKVEAERVVVALGPWSAQWAKRWGYQIPMFRKRGYHRHFAPGNGPHHPMLDYDNGAFLSPMQQGLRVCTGAEITRFDAPADLLQIRRAEQAARELFDIGDAVEVDPWIGHRPCLPDMIPVVGEAPRHKGLWFHFGHAHQGFTGGPASAQMLMQLMDGETPDWAAHFSPERFG